VKDRAGEPIAGAAVLVPGMSPVTTLADGSFSIPGVHVPYDIVLLPPGRDTAVVYDGLTRSDPTLVFPFYAGGARFATITGTVPPTAGTGSTSTHVFFVSGRDVVGGTPADVTTGAYSFGVGWRSAGGTLTGQLYVLRWTGDALGHPASYDGYASKPLTISDGSSSSGIDFTAAELTDPPEQIIAGSVTIPTGYTQAVRRLFVFFGRVPVYWEESGSLAGDFSYTVPSISGVVSGVSASAEDPASRTSWYVKNGISGNTTNVSIALQEAAHLTQPTNGASAVDTSTSFAWSPGGGTGVNIIWVTPDNGASPTFLVLTTLDHAKIPDLTAAGMGLPATTAYHWVVDKVFPVASVDDAAREGFLDLIAWDSPAVGETLSEVFAFTTKGPAGSASHAAATVQTSTAANALHRDRLLGAAGISLGHR